MWKESLTHTDQKDFKDCYAASGYAVTLALANHSGCRRAQGPPLQNIGGYAVIDERRAGAGPVPVRNPNGKGRLKASRMAKGS